MFSLIFLVYECLWSSYSWIIWVLTSIAVGLMLFSIGVIVYQRWKLIKLKSSITKQKLLESITGKENIFWYETPEYQPIDGVKGLQ